MLCYRVRAMKRSRREIAEAVEARLQGDGSLLINGVASISSASTNDLVFVDEEKSLPRALQSRAGALIAGEFAMGSTAKSLLISSHPKLTFARAARFLHDGSRDGGDTGIHETAIVDPSAHLAPTVVVAERAVIAEGVRIGEG